MNMFYKSNFENNGGESNIRTATSVNELNPEQWLTDE